MIVDVWMQHPNNNRLNEEMFASLRRWTRNEPRNEPRNETPNEPVPYETTIAAMDAGGVSISLASAWCAPNGWMRTNDEVAELVTAYPDRILGVAAVSLHKPMEAIRELRRAVNELGFRALRVVPWLWDLPPTDRRYYPLYAECIELGIPFCTQVGHTGPLAPSETGRPIPYIDQVALEFPELKIVGGHIGYPWTQEMIAVCTKHENVYIDTSAYSTKRYPRELVEYMQGNGRKKVMFGTNYPMITPTKALENLDDLGLDDEAKALFLGGNAAQVFDLELR